MAATQEQYDELNINSIHKFYGNKFPKSENDKNNKIRENIIYKVINEEIPQDYFNDQRWVNFKDEVNKYIIILCDKINIDYNNINKITCNPKGGRKTSYDFDFVFELNNNTTKIENIEFKFNTNSIDKAPQFVQISKPSEYLFESFEEYFYDNYLPKIAAYGNLEMPNRNEYIKKINNNDVNCMVNFKNKYKNDKSFKKYCGDVDKDAIKNFINTRDLNINKLTNYLMETQKNKQYMCWHKNKFYYDKMDNNDYEINSVIKRGPPNFICLTNNNDKLLQVKLRFKNYLGINWPCLSLKRIPKNKPPTVNKLKDLCRANNIYFRSNIIKSELENLLHDNGISY